MRVASALVAVVVGVVANSAPTWAAFTDNFNRTDGTDMGPKWTEVAGDFSLFGGRAYTAPGSGDNLMLATSFPTTHPVLTLDVAYGSGNATASLYARYVDSTNNIQVKFADTNGDLGFDHVYLLYGDTGQGWPGMLGGPADFAVTPFTTANLKLYLRFNFLELTIAPTGQGPGIEVFSRSGAPQPALGVQFGLGGSRASSFDNVLVRGPEPTSAVLALAAAPFLRRRRRR